MLKPQRQTILLLVILVLLTGFFLWGVPSIPFHPDESTQLFMSADAELMLTNPGDMAWQPAQPLDQRERYRLLDAPLTRYLLWFSRSLSGQPALPVDWDWTAAWEENAASGALPSESLLWAGRFGITVLLTFSVAFLFLAGRSLGGTLTGILAAAFLATNALVLLHNRRAMAEGAMMLGISLTIWLILSGKAKPWWLGLAAAIAFNSKQSTLALLPIALLVSLIPLPSTNKPGWKIDLIKPAIVLGVFAIVTFALNPFLWAHPIQGLQAASQARLDFVAGQVETLRQIAPEQVLDTPVLRALVILAQVYLAPPAVADVGNYLPATEAAAQAYFAIPGHLLFRGPVWGMVFLTLTLLGMGSFLYRWAQRRDQTETRYRLGLLFLGTVVQYAALVMTVPIPYQRYAMPMVPFACLWTAYGTARVVEIVRSMRVKRGERVEGDANLNYPGR